nr:TolC family protein [uncultured Macellibacteroides sp.]
MRYFFFLTIFFLFCTFQTVELQAQKNVELSEFNIDDYKKISLPPLDILYENAKNNPVYELAEVKEQIEISNLRKEKKAWLNYFSLRGSYQYGMFGNESTYTDVYTPVYFNYSTAAQNSYSVGAGISIPLDHLFDLKGRSNRQKMLVKSAALEKEQKFEEIKKEIIVLYSNALSQLNVLKLRSESLVITSAHYEIAEKNFANGSIDSGELSLEKQRQTDSLEQYENTKAELTKNLLILETITQTPILNR